ncbi:hypothetical protein DFH09DRAFT_1346245 [Mycena vulgaris]|nr:hypothetical protein DFH09DRAFT_1346245 [Mycena vulgaris]
MSIFAELFPPKTSRWTAYEMPDLSGRVFILTGGNTGLGKETVLHLLKKNGKVYMTSRSRQRTKAAIADLEQETGRQAIFLQLDLADLHSVKAAAAEYASKETRQNVLFNSA